MSENNQSDSGFKWSAPDSTSAGNSSRPKRPSYGLPADTNGSTPKYSYGSETKSGNGEQLNQPNAYPAMMSAQEQAQQRQLVAFSPFLPLRPLTLGDVFSTMLLFVRKAPRQIFSTAFLVLAPLSVISMLVMSFASVDYAAGYIQTINAPQEAPAIPNGLGGQIIGSAFSTLVTVIATGLLTAALAPLFMQLVLNKPVERSAATTVLRRKWISILGVVAIEVAVSVLPILAVSGGIAGIAYYFINYSPDTTTQIILVVAGLLALLVAFIVAMYIAVRFCLAFSALPIEDLKAVASIKRSWQLTSGKGFWRVFGIYLLTYVIVGFVISTIIQIPVAVFAAIVMVLSALSKSAILVAISMSITAVISAMFSMLLITPLMTAVQCTLYADQRIRREGWDVQLQRELRGEQDNVH